MGPRHRHTRKPSCGPEESSYIHGASPSVRSSAPAKGKARGQSQAMTGFSSRALTPCDMLPVQAGIGKEEPHLGLQAPAR